MKQAPGPPVNHQNKPTVTATAMSTSSNLGNQSPRQYANLGPGQSYQQRNKLRAVDVYNPSTGGMYFLITNCAKILYTRFSDKMAYAKCADPDQTVPNGAV